MKVYLAGPITGLSWGEATDWREKVKADLKEVGITCYSPLRAKTYLSHLDGQNGHIADSYSKEISPLSTPKGIITRDRWDATRCDVLFVNFLGAKKVSIGTVLEIAWADNSGKPIVVVMEPDNIHQHSMLNECAGYIVDSIEVGIHIVKALLTTM